MTAHAINDVGCVPFEGRCLLHDEELCCSHGCALRIYGSHVCDDPPPPLYVLAVKDNCIGCGRVLPVGELVRFYEEGPVCGDGCPEKEPPA